MVFDNIWEIWPFRGYFNTNNSRRHNRQSSRCGASAKCQAEPLAKLLGPWESNMVALQSVLIWERPRKSAMVVLAANLIYWYMVYSEVRFFFAVSLLGLIVFLRHQWVNYIWPEISVPKSTCEQEDWTPVHPSVLSAPEVSRYLNNIWSYIQGQQKRLAQLHRKQPGMFCVVMLVIFSLLWLLGRVVSGVTLLYLLLMGVMCGPAFIFRFVPKSVFMNIEQIFKFLFGQRDSSSQNDENDLDDFLPEETSAEVQTALGIPLTTHEPKEELKKSSKSKSKSGKAKVKSRRREKDSAADSNISEVGSSFTVGLSESDFPSLEITEDTLEESDLALPEDVLDSRVNPTEAGMNFVPTHFGDSSDEEEFSIGLAFNKTPHPAVVDGQPVREIDLPSMFPLGASNPMFNLQEKQVESYVSVLGQHLASAIGSRVIALAQTTTTADTTTTASISTPIVDIPKVANSDSSSYDDDEDFELISDDDLQ